jgi:hypothetical protein
MLSSGLLNSASVPVWHPGKYQGNRTVYYENYGLIEKVSAHEKHGCLISQQRWTVKPKDVNSSHRNLTERSQLYIILNLLSNFTFDMCGAAK